LDQVEGFFIFAKLVVEAKLKGIGLHDKASEVRFFDVDAE
jgi:hypothetical protein